QRPQLKASQTSLFLFVTLAILFGTLWMSIYASRRITGPIKALVEATGKLAEGGYGHRVDVVAGDEVGRLIDSFNTMSMQIAETNRRLDNERAYLFTVLDSVSAGIIAFSDSFELLSLNRAAVQMLQIETPLPRARLTDVLMGDLTPLFDTIRELTLRASRGREVTLIRGGDADTGAAVDEGTRTIVSEVAQLKRMVDEFSRFARMPAAHLRHAQLAEILQQAASLYRAVKPDVTVSVHVDADIELLVDPEQIRRAVGNLLKNAVEATDRGEIRVSARRAPHRVVIEVADPGRGVPDADKDKLFLPYFSTKGRGTGLGLAIVHRIVN